MGYTSYILHNITSTPCDMRTIISTPCDIRTIISALVLGKLFYCSTLWSNTTATNIKKLQAFQNFACRIITKTKKFEYITPALREIKGLPVNEHLHYRDTTATNIKKLQAFQNFACRIITKTKKFEYITPALREIKGLPVNEHLHYRDTVMTLSCMKGLVPTYLCESLRRRKSIHCHNTENPLIFLQARQSQASDVSFIEQLTFGTI